MLALAALAGCAQAGSTCATCPTATLTANGKAELQAMPGDMIAYTWSSTNADRASSTVQMTPAPDHCGNMDGAWVIQSLHGASDPAAILPCQSGTTYALEFDAERTSTGDIASAIVTITVP